MQVDEEGDHDLPDLGIDHAAVFDATPSPFLLLRSDLIICDVNAAYLRATSRARGDLIGRHVFDAFPDNPKDPEADGVAKLGASLRRVLETSTADTMALQKYDIPVAGVPGGFEERWWSPVNTPVLDIDGEVVQIIHRVIDVTELVTERELARRQSVDVRERTEAVEVELFARSRDLAEANRRLRLLQTQEHEVALALQEAMLPTLLPPGWERQLAVRYQPALRTLNVCGDWYDLVELSPNRLAVAVGDVVGNGLAAAGVMGQLRSALSAAIRAVDDPARALDVVDLYARSIAGAMGTSAVQTIVDESTRTITYSSAGHLPAMLVCASGKVERLDQGRHLLLAAPLEHSPRPRAHAEFSEGDTLVLYTDGLIERRGQTLEQGLQQLCESLTRYMGADPDDLADGVLADLDIPHQAIDDTALVVLKLRSQDR